jgi:hypothetical protein
MSRSYDGEISKRKKNVEREKISRRKIRGWYCCSGIGRASKVKRWPKVKRWLKVNIQLQSKPKANGLWHRKSKSRTVAKNLCRSRERLMSRIEVNIVKDNSRRLRSSRYEVAQQKWQVPKSFTQLAFQVDFSDQYRCLKITSRTGIIWLGLEIQSSICEQTSFPHHNVDLCAGLIAHLLNSQFQKNFLRFLPSENCSPGSLIEGWYSRPVCCRKLSCSSSNILNQSQPRTCTACSGGSLP